MYFLFLNYCFLRKGQREGRVGLTIWVLTGILTWTLLFAGSARWARAGIRTRPGFWFPVCTWSRTRFAIKRMATLRRAGRPYGWRVRTGIRQYFTRVLTNQCASKKRKNNFIGHCNLIVFVYSKAVALPSIDRAFFMFYIVDFNEENRIISNVTSKLKNI